MVAVRATDAERQVSTPQETRASVNALRRRASAVTAHYPAIGAHRWPGCREDSVRVESEDRDTQSRTGHWRLGR